ncbi:MAG: iron complex outermembrane receptor protein, partial [Halieaceae bacterium]
MPMNDESTFSNTASSLHQKTAMAAAVSVALTGQAVAVMAQDAEVERSGGLEEVIVTARKRAESLQKVSASIQAFSGDELERQGLQNMEDVIRFLPSVGHVGGTAGANKIIFRGVSDSAESFIAASSAALYIDEQPLTQFAINPEPRMVDIERVESLAGPQGTLYGDSSQSGTLRIITNKPDTSGFTGRIDVSGSTGPESSASHDVSLVLNIPVVEDKFAIRIVGFTAEDGGYVDNVFGVSPMLGTKDNSSVVGDDINSVQHSGMRVSAKWHINDDWSATVAGIWQQTEAEGRNDFDPLVGDLKTVKFYKDTRDDDWWQAALTLEGSIGNIDFLSNTSYFERDIDYVFDRTDYSAYFNTNFCPYYAYYCWSGTTKYNQDTVGFNTLIQENARFTQEVRLSRNEDNYQWVLGAFYEDKSEDWVYRAITPEFLDSLSYDAWTTYYEPSGVDPSWWLSADSSNWTQKAVFGNFSYDFDEHWSAEVGLRWFEVEQEREYWVDKPFIITPAYPDVFISDGKTDDLVSKVSVTYNFDDEKMMYALFSEGFRSGGINRNRTPFSKFPVSYNADTLSNYEIGAKSRWMDGKLQVNATLFFMQWEDYQVEVVDPSFQPCEDGQEPEVDFCAQPFQVVVANVGDAEQIGLELDVKAAPTNNWELGANLLVLQAETATTFEVTKVVEKGSRLPNTPELKFNAYAQYTWPTDMVEGAEMYARLQYSYQGDSL